MDWIQFIVFVGGVFGLFFWNRSESRTDNRVVFGLIQGFQAEIRSIQMEMKDFHGRLERIDAEFKGRMEKQDAEFRGRIEKSDAEFKAHLMYGHYAEFRGRIEKSDLEKNEKKEKK